jgi:hypothetical protein
MRIPDDFLQAVCFIGVAPGDGSSPRFGGTAFFVEIDIEGLPNYHTTYLVTARHNLYGAQADAAKTNGNVCLRMNTVDGGTQIVLLMDDLRWLIPEEPGPDVVALNWLPSSEIRYRTIGRGSLATWAIIEQYKIGPGDDLHMVGLFRKRVGQQQNQPIVRSGIISAMPSEPIWNRYVATEMHGCWLAELRSIHGLSGSPVWATLPIGRPDYQTGSGGTTGKFFLLGLIHGHWPLDKSTFAMTDYGDEAGEPLNTGIAVITPITDLLDLIDSPGEIDYRAMLAKEAQDEDAPVED